MKIHRLRLRAFGPFPDEYDVDFDALGEAGLHLIHGATGSGKTSILDAICFAVFGQVAGSRRGLGGPASALADPATTPEVELEATIAGRRWRFTRRPDHVRPKKRSTGFTTVRSSVALHEWHRGQWQPVSSRVQEVQHVVDTSLGLRLDQFAQVIMLPQGGFAEFLHAEPDARAGVLRRLFDIERFADLEQWFTEQRRLAAERLATARQPMDRARTVVELALADLPSEPSDDAQEPPDGPPPAPGPDTCAEEQLPAVVTQTADEVAARAIAASAQADAADVTARTARVDLVRAEQTAALHARGSAARQSLDQLDSPETKAARLLALSELDAAERAARVEPTVRHLRSAERAAAEAERACAVAVPALLRDHDPAAGDDTPATYWSSVVQASGEDIRSASERAVDVASALRQEAEATQRKQELVEQQRGVEQQIEQVRAQRDQVDEQVADLVPVADGVETAAELVRVVDAAARRATKAHAARESEQLYAGAVRDTDASVSAATQHAEARRRAYVSQLTGHLAADLREGEPCAVCGATEHPAPADLPAGEVVTQDDVEAAEDAQRGTKDAFDAAMTDLTRAQATRLHAVTEAELALAAAQSMSSDLLPDAPGEAPADPEALTTWLQDLRTRADQHLDRGRDARDRASALTERREQLGTEGEALAATLIEVRLDQASAQTRAREAAGTAVTQAARASDGVDAHDRVCPCHADTDTAVDAAQLTEVLQARLARHDALEAEVTAWRAAEQRQVETRRRRSEAHDTLTALIAQESFASAEEVEQAARPAAHREALRVSLDAAARARTEAETVLADDEVIAATDAPPPDLPALRAAAEVAETRARAARDNASVLERSRGLLLGAARDLAAALDELAPARARHDALEALAAVINGDRGAEGDRRMRLSAYVLAARLEEVVRLANERLGTMTDQRFTLEHDDGPGSRGSRGGLGLRVHDAWTGSSRSTRSLSGGETFLAALSLALGLGDAIQQDVGGRQLETLFVDEGFGSLDDDSLELVLEVLDELRSGGRTVGIVSHVAELRQRIPAQIEVRKAESGSSVHVHLPGRSAAA